MLILFHRRSKNKRHPDQRYHDRPQANVLITGASSGIGKATALYLAERGYTVIATSRDASRLDGLHADADTLGMSVIGVELDINSDDAVSCIVPQLIERYGAMDALVNNAGFGMWGPVEILSDAELKSQFETNFFAAVRMIRAVLPAMIEQRRGTIVNVRLGAGAHRHAVQRRVCVQQVRAGGRQRVFEDRSPALGRARGDGGAGPVPHGLPR